MFDANEHIQEITRDLKLCETVKEERDILTQYNAALKIQLQAEAAGRIKSESETQKFRTRSKRRFRIILVLGAAILINLAITK